MSKGPILSGFMRDEAGIITAHFVCQRCAQPLRLEKSLYKLDEPTLAELAVLPLFPHGSRDTTLSLDQTTRTSMASSSEVVELARKYPSNDRSSENGHNGFMLIGESPNKDTDNFSHAYKVMSRLFDVLSDQSDVDHPLCEECTDNLLDQMDDQLKMTEEELKDYSEFLERLKQSPAEDDILELDNELHRLRMEEAELERELRKVEEDKLLALKELEVQTKEKELLKSDEAHYLKEYCNHKRQQILFDDEHRSVDNQLRYAQAHLDKLRKTNVFNASFHIWHNGQFGTINNFRLGRLPNTNVEWHEINAAWGQAVLLLHSLANKINLKFQRYRLVPYGNHSYVECLDDNLKELPLYGAGGIRFFWDTKFDAGMVAFLDCMQQFKDAIESRGPGFSLPYKMDKGKIEDKAKGPGTQLASYSIKIQFNSEEQWTKALKYMLTNLKWGLAWVSSQFAAER
ncbi:Beclin-1 [Chamberlinius hualienensis]